jgi:hypothetical protein
MATGRNSLYIIHAPLFNGVPFQFLTKRLVLSQYKSVSYVFIHLVRIVWSQTRFNIDFQVFQNPFTCYGEWYTDHSSRMPAFAQSYIIGNQTGGWGKSSRMAIIVMLQLMWTVLSCCNKYIHAHHAWIRTSTVLQEFALEYAGFSVIYILLLITSPNLNRSTKGFYSVSVPLK